MLRKSLSAVFLVSYLGLVLALTLVLFKQPSPSPNLVPFRSILDDWQKGGKPFLVNFIGNVGVMMPFGLLIPYLWRHPRSFAAVVTFCFGLSVMIESLQYLGARRVADVDDVILNTIGGVLGYWLFRLSRLIQSACEAKSTDCHRGVQSDRLEPCSNGC